MKAGPVARRRVLMARPLVRCHCPRLRDLAASQQAYGESGGFRPGRLIESRSVDVNHPNDKLLSLIMEKRLDQPRR